MTKGKRIALATASSMFAFAIVAAGPARAVELKEAVQAALVTNPQILQAVHNREATEQELRQGKGLYGPRVSVDGSGGVRWLKNGTRRDLNIANDTLYPVEGGVTVEQLLVDFGRARAEVERQASRTDGAAHRVRERSEYITLNVARYYIDYLLQQRLVAAAQDNVAFHERLAGDLRQGVSQGSISIADQQQAEERLQAARVKLTEANEELANAGISFQQLSGVPIGQPTMAPDLRAQVPASIDQAVDTARLQNPLVREAMADIDAAHAEYKGARAELAPRISLEGNARVGNDIDGFSGRTEDYQGRVVLRWTVFDSGINRAKVNEGIGRESERRARLNEMGRQAEADARMAWTRLEQQTKLVGELEQQSRVSDDLLLSYREQFNIGRRSLLDVLDAQNTRYNVQVQAETARLAQLYAQYRVLASASMLMDALGVSPNAASVADVRERNKVKTVSPANVMEPRQPYGPPQ